MIDQTKREPIVFNDLLYDHVYPHVHFILKAPNLSFNPIFLTSVILNCSSNRLRWGTKTRDPDKEAHNMTSHGVNVNDAHVEHVQKRQFKYYNLMVIGAMSFASMGMGYSASIIGTTLGESLFSIKTPFHHTGDYLELSDSLAMTKKSSTTFVPELL